MVVHCTYEQRMTCWACAEGSSGTSAGGSAIRACTHAFGRTAALRATTSRATAVHAASTTPGANPGQAVPWQV